jgi:isopentenyl diphosphate isomerase/L-lactate dehydrogenase-like FMN-dependent dehydrogenase
MPAGYEKIKDKLKKQGLSTKAAKTKAAKIWNSKHKGRQAVGRGK